MKNYYLRLKAVVLTFLLICCFSWQAKAQNEMIVASPYQDSIWVCDTSIWATALPGLALNLPGSTVTGCNGLAIQPGTNDVFAIIKVSGVTGRMLCTLDPTTGDLTPIGNTGDNVANIDFADANTLIAVTGDGATTGESLWDVDINTGFLTLIAGSAAGSDGESMAYCPDDGFFYRWSGRDTNPAMERWDHSTGTFTTVTRSGFNYDEVFGSTYVGNGWFLLANLDQQFVYVDTSGFAINTGNATHDYYKGMVFWQPGISIANTSGSDNICSGDTAWLQANINDTIQWYLDGSAIAGADSGWHAATASGVYTAIGQLDGVIDTSNAITITVTPSPVLAIDNNDPSYICTGDSLLLTGTFTGADTLRWLMDTTVIVPSDNDSIWVTQPGMYTFEGMDLASQCGASSTPINVLAQPVLTATPGGSADGCPGDTIMLYAAPTDADSYEWLMDGSTIAGATDTMYNATMSGDYDVVATWGGCTDTVDAADVNIFAMPTLSPQGSTAICVTDSIMLMTDTGAVSYQWYHDGNPVGPNMPSLNAFLAGDYSVTVVYGGGLCMDSLSGTTITVDQLNDASFTQDLDTVDLATMTGDVVFTNTGGGTTYSWDFGDGGSSTSMDPTHTYTAVGVYTVTVTVGGNACPDDVATSTVVVINTTGIETNNAGVTLLQNRPNPFNGHTTFQFNLKESAQVSLKVYNILGDEVKDVYNGNAAAGINTVDWNGSDNEGNALAAGTYVYRLTVDGVGVSNTLVIMK